MIPKYEQSLIIGYVELEEREGVNFTIKHLLVRKLSRTSTSSCK